MEEVLFSLIFKSGEGINRWNNKKTKITEKKTCPWTLGWEDAKVCALQNRIMQNSVFEENT